MKTIAVASGKGGAGKTTLTALLFAYASDQLDVVLADADVEASNLPIALGITDEECESFKGGSTAHVVSGRCSGCGVCVEVCRFDALSIQLDPRSSSQKCFVDEWACEGCTHCAYVCPTGAIRMEPASAGKVCTARSGDTPIAFGQLTPGEDLSGRLVSEVRKRAVMQAKDADADLILIDGPPGIGCPTIAAIADIDLLVAVTEPTVSGEHDLSRLLELSSRFDLDQVVVLNKADLSAEGSKRIRDFCASAGVELLAELPFDNALAAARLAGGTSASSEDSPALEQVRVLWEQLVSRLENRS